VGCFAVFDLVWADAVLDCYVVVVDSDVGDSV